MAHRSLPALPPPLQPPQPLHSHGHPRTLHVRLNSPTTPQVTASMEVRVGSSRVLLLDDLEGHAHFLEHMLFYASRHHHWLNHVGKTLVDVDGIILVVANIFLAKTDRCTLDNSFVLESMKLLQQRRELLEELGINLLKDAFEDSDYVPYDVSGQYGQLFSIIERKYKADKEAQLLALQKQANSYAPIRIDAALADISEADREALTYIVKAAKILNEIFYSQVCYIMPALRDWLKELSAVSKVNRLKWIYFSINKSPWSCIDDNKAFLSTADSAVKLPAEITKPVSVWKGIEYKAAFPIYKPPGANFYPPDMDKKEFELWKHNLLEDEQKAAIGYFNVIRRHSDFSIDASLNSLPDLFTIPISKEYRGFLSEAAKLLHKAGEITDSLSLKCFLHARADVFLKDDYYESDIAWMELNSKLDVTIGPYETLTNPSIPDVYDAKKSTANFISLEGIFAADYFELATRDTFGLLQIVTRYRREQLPWVFVVCTRLPSHLTVDGDCGQETSTEPKDAKKRCIILELASSLIEGADEALVNKLFVPIKSVFQAFNDIGQVEAYHTLSNNIIPPIASETAAALQMKIDQVNCILWTLYQDRGLENCCWVDIRYNVHVFGTLYVADLFSYTANANIEVLFHTSVQGGIESISILVALRTMR